MMLEKICDAAFVKKFCRMANEGYLRGWHERNGGNLSYRLAKEDIEEVRGLLCFDAPFEPIGTEVKNLAGSFFLVSGSGKYFQNILPEPEKNIALIELNETGTMYRKVWGLCEGGRPTSELPAHLMNHSVKLEATGGLHHVIYHAHPANLIALTFVLPLDSKTFSHLLWEMMTECPIIFPDGVGVVPWMVPGGEEIALATGELMKKQDAAVWAHHGLFCSGEDFDLTFGLMDTIEKASSILVKVLSIGGIKQTITDPQFHELAKAFGVHLNEEVFS